MFNPRSLVYALYTHWDTVEILVRISREYAAFTSDQVLKIIAKVNPQLNYEEQTNVLRSLVNADILHTLSRSNDFQLNVYVLEFARSLTREHELSLAAVLQARVTGIREATQILNAAMAHSDIDRMRESSNKLAELFRQISLQLNQDKHAILEVAEKAKSSDSNIPIAQRYQHVLEVYEQYVEPMNQMMDTGPQGTFYHYLEDAERSLDLALEQLSVQGALYSHRLQLRQVSHQAKELRRFGRIVALQCADTLLPLREELRQHNTLTNSISLLLSMIRKRGLRFTLSSHQDVAPLPVWRNERGFKLQLGDEVRTVMADAKDYQPQSVTFPQEESIEAIDLLESVDEIGIREHLMHSLPITDLLDWLQAHYSHLQDSTLLRIFHDLQHESNWTIEADPHIAKTKLTDIAILHFPHRVNRLP